MRLIDELRSSRPQVIADLLEQAVNYWSDIEDRMRAAAKRGMNYVTLAPKDATPGARAVCAAVAERAKAEGFKVTRINREPDAVAAALGAAEGVAWKVSW